MIGWALLSRDQVDRAEAALSSDDQGVLDEIGLLTLQQVFADRFFPGTSVLHTHLRYALFVPWVMQESGGDADRLRRLEIQIVENLAQRWDKNFSRPFGIIGVESLLNAPSQAPSRIYWGALNAWNIVQPTRSRAAVLGQLKAHALQRSKVKQVDGESLEDAVVSPFVDHLPSSPEGWLKDKHRLNFSIEPDEREFFRKQWIGLRRGDVEGSQELSVLAQLAGVNCKTLHSLVSTPGVFPWDRKISRYLTSADQNALVVAQQAASMACIARAVYAALLEQACNLDGLPKKSNFKRLLEKARDEHSELAGALDFDALRGTVSLPDNLLSLLEQTKDWLIRGRSRPEALFDIYCKAEFDRKKGRARLLRTDGGKKRRAEWNPDEHQDPQPLHYRWKIVRTLLEEYSEGER